MPQIPITSALGYIGIFFLISGAFLIISGVGIIKIEKITITPGRKTWGLGLILLVAGFFFLLPEVNKGLQSLVPTPTATTTIIPTMVSITPTMSAVPQITPAPVTVFISSDTIHLGDETLQGWTKLSGICSNTKFNVNLPLQAATLRFETYGAEAKNSIALNGNIFAILPPQGALQPNFWTESSVIISLPIDKLLNGENEIGICAEKVEVQPSFSGDLDDFQIRNMNITVQP